MRQKILSSSMAGRAVCCFANENCTYARGLFAKVLSSTALRSRPQMWTMERLDGSFSSSGLPNGRTAGQFDLRPHAR
jgi:hypothetical protein